MPIDTTSPVRTIVIPLNRRGQIDDCLEATGGDLLADLHTAVRTAASPDAKEDEIVHRNTCQILAMANAELNRGAQVMEYEAGAGDSAVSLRFCRSDLLRKYSYAAIAGA